jgi:phospholipid/cholesterol/gamma-HCH transport system substrate-binding protein
VDLTYKQEIGVGALVLMGLVVFTVGLFWMTGRSIKSTGLKTQVVFSNVSGLKAGDPVMVSGVKKGRVAGVKLDRVGRVTVTLEIDPNVRPRVDASAQVSSLDFFGAKFVDYSPGSDDKPPLSDGHPIVGTTPPGLTDVAQGLATRANELLGNASGIVNRQLAEDIHNTLVATQRGMNVLTEAGTGTMIRQTTATLASVERVMAHVDSLLGHGKKVDSLGTDITQLTAQLKDATASLNSLLAKVNKGEGTLGRLASDTTLYNDLHRTLNALTDLLTDLKERPGRYVHVKVF